MSNYFDMLRQFNDNVIRPAIPDIDIHIHRN